MNTPQKAYILGIPRNYRGVPLERQLRSCGLPFEVIEGSDSRDLHFDLNPFKKITSPKQIGFGMSPGEFACFLGHLRMIQKASSDMVEIGFFFEDDAELLYPERFRFIVDNFAELPDGIFCLYRGPNLVFIGKELTILGVRFKKSISIPTRTIAYMMNRNTIKQYVKNVQADNTILQRADYPLTLPGDVRIFTSSESFFSERDEVSIIGLREPKNISNIEKFRIYSFYSWLLNYRAVPLRRFIKQFHFRYLSENLCKLFDFFLH